MNSRQAKKELFSDPDLLIQYYAIQSEDFRMRHTAIWTEVQHYTWVLSLLLSALPYALFTCEQARLIEFRGLLYIAPALGITISAIAFLIILKDFKYYFDADARRLYLEKRLGALKHIHYLDDRLSRAASTDFSVRSDTKEQSPIKLSFQPKIRQLILMTFIVYLIAGIIEICYLNTLKKEAYPPPTKQAQKDSAPPAQKQSNQAN